MRYTGIVLITAMTLLPGELASQNMEDSVTQTLNRGLASIRIAQDRADSLERILTNLNRRASSAVDMAKSIREIQDGRRRHPGLDAARQQAAEAETDLTSLRDNSAVGIQQQRSVSISLDSIRGSLTKLQRSDFTVRSATLLEKMDDALEPTIATALAAASLTFAGLLLGFGMPILVSEVKRPTKPSDDEIVKRARHFQGKFVGAAVKVLYAFLAFAFAIIENVSVDATNWSFIPDVSRQLELGIDVGTEISSLGTGILYLVWAVCILASGVKYLLQVETITNKALKRTAMLGVPVAPAPATTAAQPGSPPDGG